MILSDVLDVEVMLFGILVQAVSLLDLIKMAKAIITFKLMPESPDVDRKPIKELALKIAREMGAIGEMQSKEEPIAFGLVAVLIMAMYDVDKADFDVIAAKMAEIEFVQNAEVAKMDLAIG